VHQVVNYCVVIAYLVQNDPSWTRAAAFIAFYVESYNDI